MAKQATWNDVQSDWRAEQDRRGVHVIEQTVRAQTPSGRAVEANRFDYNLAYAADRYVQLTDGSWLKARNLQVRTRKSAA